MRFKNASVLRIENEKVKNHWIFTLNKDSKISLDIWSAAYLWQGVPGTISEKEQSDDTSFSQVENRNNKPNQNPNKSKSINNIRVYHQNVGWMKGANENNMIPSGPGRGPVHHIEGTERHLEPGAIVKQIKASRYLDPLECREQSQGRDLVIWGHPGQWALWPKASCTSRKKLKKTATEARHSILLFFW